MEADWEVMEEGRIVAMEEGLMEVVMEEDFWVAMEAEHMVVCLDLAGTAAVMAEVVMEAASTEDVDLVC